MVPSHPSAYAQTSSDKDKAKAAFKKGKQHRDAGEWDLAIQQLETAYALAPLPQILFTSGLCYRAKGDKATPAEQKQLFLTELKFDLIPAAEIQARSDRFADLSAAERELVTSKLVDAEVRAVFDKGRELGQEKVGATLAELAKAGKRPSETMSGTFWRIVLQHASKQKDAALAQRAYDELMKRYGMETGARIDSSKQAWQKLLEDAKAK